MKRFFPWVMLAAVVGACGDVGSGRSSAGLNIPPESGDTICSDPLLVDVGTGVGMSSVANGAPFDARGVGVRDLAAWPTNGAWLVLDVDHDGAITSGRELFGSASKVPGGLPSLAEYDRNGDRVITFLDPVFQQLQLWTDKNRDGISQFGELQYLADAGVASISLVAVGPSRTDVYGNVFAASAPMDAGMTLWSVIPTTLVEDAEANDEPVCMGGMQTTNPVVWTCSAKCFGAPTASGDNEMFSSRVCGNGHICGGSAYTDPSTSQTWRSYVATGSASTEAEAKVAASNACRDGRSGLRLGWSSYLDYDHGCVSGVIGPYDGTSAAGILMCAAAGNTQIYGCHK